MNGKLIGGLAVVVLVAPVGAGALATGFGPAPGGDSGTPAPTPVSTGTVYDGDGGGSDGGGSDTTATQAPPPFDFTIDSIEKCGQTCRDVTATLSNQQSTAASGVTVYTQIYAGNTTDSDDRVWSGTEDVGALAANDSYTSTNRVELSLTEANKVQNNDGWITIVTTVESDDTTITFTERRDVA
ncbi:hypothetical protein [Halosegnis sp.]|uniref:hypothetical protein n=1 Tax=Halosegnis sp. TaxID=2864959 RepID=UPI0035D4F708